MDTFTKLAYLRVSIKDPHIHALLRSGAETDEHYDEMIAMLHKRYDQKRIVHCTYTHNLFEWTPIARESREELRAIRDSLATNIRGLKNTKQWDASSLATSMVAWRLPKATQTVWETETKDIPGVTPIEDLLEFLDRREASLPDSFSQNSKISAKQENLWKQKAAGNVPQASSNSAHPKPKLTCSLCNGDRHNLYTCPVFKTMAVDDKNAHVKGFGYCFNCLGHGHRTRDCRSSSRCKKCGKNHRSCLHKDSSSAAPTTDNAAASNTAVTKLCHL